MPVENLDSNLDIMRLNPAHITEFSQGFVLDNRYIKTIYDTEPPEHVVYVSPNFNDDEDNFKFSTIQGAIDYIYGSSWYSSLDERNKALIIVHPGIYTEQIHSYNYIIISSQPSTIDVLATELPTTIYNTGADAAHYPLRSDEDEVYSIVGLNIETDTDGIIGKIPVGDFHNCRFVGGYFIERNSSNLAIFSKCQTVGSSYAGFLLEGTDLVGFRNLLFRNKCIFGHHSTPQFLSTHTLWSNFKCEDVEFSGSVTVKGDWDWRVSNCYSYRIAQRNILDTTGEVNVVDSIMMNGLHFISNPDSFKMINSSFEGISDNQIPDGEADITSDVTITDAIYSGNTQHNGICGCIQIQCPVKSVGCAALNRYFSVQDAVDSIAVKGVVDLRDSFTGLAELVLPGGADVSIDGHKLYSLTFTGDIVEVGASGRFGLIDMVGVTGGNIEMNGASAELSMESCQYVTAYVTLTNGAFAILYKSSLFGATGHPAVSVNTTTPTVVIGYSRCQGATGQPAVTFSVDTDNKFKSKFSTFIHGNKDGTAALVSTVGSGKIDMAMYMCGLNGAWDANNFTNLVGSAGIATDAEIDF